MVAHSIYCLKFVQRKYGLQFMQQGRRELQKQGGVTLSSEKQGGETLKLILKIAFLRVKLMKSTKNRGGGRPPCPLGSYGPVYKKNFFEESKYRTWKFRSQFCKFLVEMNDKFENFQNTKSCRIHFQNHEETCRTCLLETYLTRSTVRVMG